MSAPALFLLALAGLGSAAFEARTAHLARPQGNGGAYAGVQYADGERAPDAARPGFGYRGQVVLAGADKRLNPGLTLGGALSTGRLSARVDAAGGNYLLVWPRQVPADVDAALRRAGILVRSMAGKPLIDGSLRVSLGTTAQMQQFWQAYGRIEGFLPPV